MTHRIIIDTRLATWPFPLHLYGDPRGVVSGHEVTAGTLRLCHHFWAGGGADVARQPIIRQPPTPNIIRRAVVRWPPVGPLEALSAAEREIDARCS